MLTHFALAEMLLEGDDYTAIEIDEIVAYRMSMVAPDAIDLEMG